MSLTYDQFVTQAANMVPISSADANFQTMLPGAIDYSEQRIYRELDLIATQITDATQQASSGNRNFTLPNSTTASPFITVDQINLISPAGTVSSAGTRYPLTP